MTNPDPLKTHLQELQNKLSTGDTTEHTHRPSSSGVAPRRDRPDLRLSPKGPVDDTSAGEQFSLARPAVSQKAEGELWRG
jgi:hypothetical protein